MIDTYIFDLDDTLIDSSIYARMYNEIINRIIVDTKISEIELQKQITILKEESGKTRPDTFELCKILNCIELYYTVLERYLGHTYILKNSSVVPVLKKIKANNKRIGIVSNSQERTISLFLERFNLSKYIDYIVSGNKMTVLFWIQLQKKHSLSKAATLVIDDSDEVLKVAENAGYKVLNVKNINELEGFGW